MDGVLIDSEIVYMRRLKEFTREAAQREVPRKQLLKMVGATSEGHWKAVRAYFPPEWTREQFFEAYRVYGRSHPVSYQDIVFEDTIPTLKRLKAMGLRLAMATSTPREKAMETKELCGFGSFMEIVLCGDMVKESKPNPEIYLKCLEQLGLSGEQCIVVEDSAYGIEAAKRAGLYVLARRETRFSMNQEGADCYINRLGELPRLLENM